MFPSDYLSTLLHCNQRKTAKWILLLGSLIDSGSGMNQDDIELASRDWLLISFISIDAQSGRFVEISGCLKQWKACLLQQTIDFGAGGKRSLHSMFNVWTTKRKQPLVSKTNSVWKFTILRYMKRLHRCFIQILTLFK